MMALRAFEAGARLGSFTLAAEELRLTQSAISRHVRNLEAQLDVTLFHRSGRNLTLTPEGRDYMAAISDTFDRISAATVALCRRQRGGVFTVGMSPSLAAKWLAPRLSGFFRTLPDVDLRVVTSAEPTDCGTSGIDVAVRFGHGDWLGTQAEELSRERMVPVCSPGLAAAARLWRDAAGAVTLLHGAMHEDWRAWSKVAGLDHLDVTGGPRFNDEATLIQAAVEGIGMALVPALLVRDDLRAGRLVAPFPTDLAVQSSYWLVTPRGQRPHPRLATFRSWLAAELAGSSVRE